MIPGDDQQPGGPSQVRPAETPAVAARPGLLSSAAVVFVGNVAARGLGFLFPLVLTRVVAKSDFAMVYFFINTGFSVGELVLAQELPDGRFNLVVRGRARIGIDEELFSEEPYRLIAAHEIPDDPTVEATDIDEADTTLRALVSGLAESIPDGGELLKHVAAAQDTPAALANVVAASLVADAKARQRLLETTDVFERLERLSSEVVALIDRVGKPGRAN